jgi:uncharacterized alpha-E superfamily protein
VKYYVLLPQIEMVGGGVDNVQWGAILRSVSAHRSYRWVYKQNYRPWKIAEYLILNQAMPRSLRSCYDEINMSLNDIGELYGAKPVCHETASATRRLLARGNIDNIFQSGLHEFIEDFIVRNNRLGNEVAEAYHFTG